MLTPALAWTDDVDSRTNVYVRRWMRHFPLLRATYVENWLDGLREVTLPTEVRTFTPDERDLLLEDYWRRDVNRPGLSPDAFEPIVLGLEERVLRAQCQSPTGAAFVRLGSRAPLDSSIAMEGDLQVDGGPEALEVLLDSARVFDDMCLAQECGYCPAIAIRPWLEIDPGLELRAFVKGRRLVGLSQRHAEGALPLMIARASELESRARARCEELAPRWPLEDLVVDFACLDDETWVVDLHPWLPWSDGALFSWDEDDFSSYAFRYLRAE